MDRCNVCHEESERLIEGMCPACFSANVNSKKRDNRRVDGHHYRN